MRAVEARRKTKLRREILKRRDALSEAERLDKSNIIWSRVVQTWEFQQAESVMLYAAFGSEVCTDRLMESTLQAGKRLILPRVNRAAPELELYYVANAALQVESGFCGIPEPAPQLCERTLLTDVDCVVVPGIAFDPLGGRLGYGGGYYDRLLNSLSPAQAHVSIGLAYEVQIVEEIPQGFFDARVAVIATELRLLVENR